MMRRYIVVIAVTVVFAGVAQAQSMSQSLSFVGSMGVPTYRPPVLSDPATEGAAFLLTGLDIASATIQRGPTALPAILLDGTSPIVAFGLPAVVDPFQPETLSNYYSATNFIQPLHQAISPAIASMGTQVLLGGNGPFLITGLMDTAGSQDMSLPGL